MVRSLTHDQYGLSRYKGDDYYFTNRYSPAGDEVLAVDPVWPQMSMWVAIHEARQQRRDAALGRLQWFIATMASGFMPQGEAVSYVTRQSVLSSMCEPLTASSFVLAALAYEGQYSLELLPPVHNAGTHKTIAVGGDWGQWSNVPYFLPMPATAGSSMTSLKRAYVTNDDDHFYFRIDNLAGTLSPLAAEPRFAVRLYGEDFARGAEASNLGLAGAPLRRPLSFAVERRSDDNVSRRWRVAAGRWANAGTVDGAARWDAATGRFEAAVPIAALASATPAPGEAWGQLQLVLARHDATNDQWIEDSSILIHYRLSTAQQPWIYGNIER
jgi:hypothetical protein